MRILALIDNGIARFEAFVLAFGVLMMAANSIANVVGRFVFSQSIYFTEELNQFLIVLVTFVGLGYRRAQGSAHPHVGGLRPAQRSPAQGHDDLHCRA